MVAEVSVTDSGIWTIPLSACTFIRKGSAQEHDKAYEHRDGIVNHNRRIQSERRNNRFEAAKQNDLLNLNAGEPVIVEFRDGKRPCTFLGWTSTGRAKVISSVTTREYSVSPQFVTRVK